MINIAIDSVINQSYKNWELIVVNDGSIDNTEEVVKNYQLKDNRIKYYFQQNKGRSSARNLGIEYSSGEYVSFLDDDDYYLEDYLEEFNSTIIDLGVDSEFILMCEQFEKIENKLGLIKYDQSKLISNPINYLIGKSNNLQPFVIPRSLLLEDKFDTRFEIGEDFHLLFRILIKSKVKFVSKSLCVYTNHPDMTMERELNEGMFLSLKYNRLDVIDDLFKLNNEKMYFKNWKNVFFIKYNQICYFYASKALKLFEFKKSINFVSKIKIFINFQTFYFIFSVFLRLPFYLIKYFFSKDVRKF